MNNRTGRTILSLAVAAALTLPATALVAQSSGGQGGGSGHHGGSGGGSGGGSHGGSGNQGGYRGHGGHSGGHSSSYRGSYGGYRGYYGGYRGYYGGYYGGFGYPAYYGGWYGWPYAGGGWGYTTVYPAVGAAHGALDLDVSPESAQIYVDGDLVGTADDYDGFPDFLWLQKGTYDVVIFAPGFQTISRQYSIYGGLVIAVNDTMVRGQETLPQDLVSKSTVNREERLRRDRENEAEARAYDEAQGGRYDDEEETAAPSGERVPESLDARGEPGSLRLEIDPDDASVYLDGRFLGTGRELARLRAGLIVDPGEHRIEVVRPGRQSEEETFSVRAGEEISLEIELDEE